MSARVCHVRYAALHSFDSPAQSLDWLAGDELHELRRIGDAGRRRQWIAGRILSRGLLYECFPWIDTARLQILSRDHRGLGVKPRVLVAGRPLEVQLSLSHSSRGAIGALSPDPITGLGVDLCEPGSMTPGLQRAWFSPAEHAWVAGDAIRAATVWALKEAVYKAAANGAPWNPRHVEVVARSGDQLECQFQDSTFRPAQFRVWQIGGHVAALACPSDEFEMHVTQADAWELSNLYAVTECS
jgi:phosphopantetheinyl transferase